MAQNSWRSFIHSFEDAANEMRSTFASDSSDNTSGAERVFRKKIEFSSDASSRHHSEHSGWRWLWITLAVLIAIIFVIVLSARFITDVMWYTQLGYGSVIWTTVAMKAGLWIVYAILVGVVGFLSADMAIHSRPADKNGYSYQSQGGVIVEKKSFTSRSARRIAFWISVAVGALLGGRLLSNWNEILLASHAQSFGIRDPQFGIDIGFYVFILPALRAILAGLMTLALVGLVVCIVFQFALSGIRFRMPSRTQAIVGMTSRARKQMGTWVIITFAIAAAQVTLSAFQSLTQASGNITGAAYTQVHASIPGIFIMAALLLIVGCILGTWLMVSDRLSQMPTDTHVTWKKAFQLWKLPMISVIVLVVAGLVIQVMYPALMQQFVVNPNQQELESTYIQRNIDATVQAFGLKNVKEEPYNATTTGQAGQLSRDTETTAQIRLLDPQVVAPTFRQLQQSKQYYTFEDTLAVDKYRIRGKSYDTVIGARELNLAGNDDRNWVNDHTVYTHGYGVVAAYGNRVSKDGQPLFFEKGIPTQGLLTQTQHYEPRIYFSPTAPDYSIVGHPAGRADWEFDYPSGSSGTRNEFKGSAGPRMSNWLIKLLYSIRFKSDQIFFSDRVTHSSQILYYRSPIERIRRIAPYLELDSRVYPAVVDGRVKWIVDAYTVSDQYPYSQKVDLHSSTQDALTLSSRSLHTLTTGEANYMRNSVKATIDAYDGHVDLYAWDPHDPILRAWEKIFPGQYKPLSQISGQLMSHLRYPESIFKVQRQLLGKYHVRTASQFFSGEDFWQTPSDPTIKANQQTQAATQSSDDDDDENDDQSSKQVSTSVLQPPYYLTMQVPNRTTPTFSLSSSFIPAGSQTREILTGFFAADSDAGDQAGKIGPNYGTLRLLELPKNTNVPGPGQAQNNFNADASVSRELNLLETGSTEVVRGNLLTLPIGHGLVYVQPVYVQSSGSTQFPLLKKVLVAFGEHIGFANTLDEALDQVFGGNSGAVAGDAANSQTGGNKPSAPSSDSTGQKTDQKNENGAGNTGAVPNASDDVKNALNDANSAMDDAQAALKKGDFAAYGKAQDRLKSALKKAVDAAQGTHTK
jgi:uncharacterized membrane protein (UPF0182 family)